jgi:hypothetical protein
MISTERAEAATISVSYSDVLNPNVDLGCISVFCNNTTYTHDITDAASGAFNTATDLLTTAVLVLDFSGQNGTSEKATIQVDGSTLWSNQVVADVTFSSGVFGSLLTSLQADGTLSVSIWATNPALFGSRSFTLVSSTLSARGDRTIPDPQPVPTPEPASLLLLGSGLTGLAMRARRRKQAKA